MANINDLKGLESSEPKDFKDWLSRFNDEDRDVVAHAIITARIEDVYAVISKLEDNPYPFKRDTLNGHRAKLIKGEI